jgi:hypothetical protein
MSLDPAKRFFARRRYVREKDGWEGPIFVVLPFRKCRPDSVTQLAMASSLHLGRQPQPVGSALQSECLRSSFIPGVHCQLVGILDNSKIDSLALTRYGL